MAVENGYYRLFRGWQSDPFFGNDAFSRRDAFVWLIEKAAYSATRIYVAGKPVDLKRGQLCASLRFMATAWRWSDFKVRHFLKGLEIDQKIIADTIAGQTLLTICNYDKYQASPSEDNAGGIAEKTQEQRSSNAKYKENKEDIYNNPQSKPIDHHARENENSAGSHTDLELKILDVIHAAGMPSIPKDTNLLAVWLKKGATMEDHILPVVRRTSDRLLRDTGRAPYTFKIFHDDIAQAVAKDRAAEYARACSDQQIESMNERWEEGQRQVRERKAEMQPIYDRLTEDDKKTPLWERGPIYQRIKAEIAAEQAAKGETLQ